MEQMITDSLDYYSGDISNVIRLVFIFNITVLILRIDDPFLCFSYKMTIYVILFTFNIAVCLIYNGLS